MRRFRNTITLLAVVGLLVVLAGCQKSEPEKPKFKPQVPAATTAEEPAEEPVAKHRGKRGHQQVVKVEAPKEAPAPTGMPKVAMSEELKATNRVKVGDKLPDGELPDLAGKNQPIGKLLGRKATVLFFWTLASSYWQTELEDLQADVCKPLGEKGVQVIGVNLDKEPQKVRQAVEKTGAKFPNLLDPDKKYFSKLATEKFLRTYLVDEKGVIRWFDIEYSRSTERELLQAVEFILGAGAKK